MNIPPRIRLIGYIAGFLLAGAWASVAPYLAHRGVDPYTIALVAGIVALLGAGLHALAAGHLNLPDSVDLSGLASDGGDLSVAVLDPAATDVPAAAPAAPVVAPAAPVTPPQA